MKSNFKLKFQFYIISLIILFVLAIIVDYKCQLIGTGKFVSVNLFSIACFVFILLGFFFTINERSSVRARKSRGLTMLPNMKNELRKIIETIEKWDN